MAILVRNTFRSQITMVMVLRFLPCTGFAVYHWVLQNLMELHPGIVMMGDKSGPARQNNARGNPTSLKA